MANYIVQEQEDGKYSTRREGADRNQSTGDGIQDSVLVAEALAHKTGGGTVTVKDKNGNVVKQKEVD